MVGLAQKLSEQMSKKGVPAPDLCAGAINDNTACLLCGGCSLGRGPAGETAMDRMARQADERAESRKETTDSPGRNDKGGSNA
jgi:hypothetical protein